MTMNVVLGDGGLPAKELDALLTDLWQRSNKLDDPFWFLVQGKAEPTATDTKLVEWLIANDIYYEMISDGSEDTDLYTGFQNRYVVKRLAPKVVSLMQTTPDAGEDAQLLALFASDDPDSEEDRWLNDVLQAVNDAGFKALAMNDGMQEVKLINTDDSETPAEVEEPPVEPRKAAATKKAAKPTLPGLDEAETEAILEDGVIRGYTRAQLEELDLDGLKAVAAKLGIELPPRTRMPTYIDRILGNGSVKDEEVEITEVEIEEDEPAQLTLPLNTTSTITSGSSYTVGNTTNTFSVASISAPAMLIIIYNGTVVSRVVTEEEARAIAKV